MPPFVQKGRLSVPWDKTHCPTGFLKNITRWTLSRIDVWLNKSKTNCKKEDCSHVTRGWEGSPAVVPLCSWCFHQVQPGVRSCPNAQSIILPFSQAATAAIAAGIGYCELGALLPACCGGGWERAEGPMGIIQEAVKTLWLKQYKASRCVHKMNRLEFTVAQQTEVEL